MSNGCLNRPNPIFVSYCQSRFDRLLLNALVTPRKLCAIPKHWGKRHGWEPQTQTRSNIQVENDLIHGLKIRFGVCLEFLMRMSSKWIFFFFSSASSVWYFALRTMILQDRANTADRAEKNLFPRMRCTLPICLKKMYGCKVLFVYLQYLVQNIHHVWFVT